MPHTNFYWELIAALNDIGLSLWIGSMFYHVFGLCPSLGLLDQTQKASVLLQSLKKLSRFNAINALLVFACQIAFSLHIYFIQTINWSFCLTLITLLLMIILNFYGFTKNYQKASRALRPKPNQFDKINMILKTNILLGVINLILLNF